MTDSNPGCWPDASKPGVPMNPERDGWHWVMTREGVPFRPRACFWDASRPGWAVPGSAMFREDAAPEWRYLGPCLLPSEVAAQVEAARREGAAKGREQAARIMDDRAAREDEYSSSHARVGRHFKAREAAHVARLARQDAAAIRARGDA